MPREMDPPYCELCGDGLVTVSLKHAGACDDCAEKEFQIALIPVLGYRPCCTIMHIGGIPVLCLHEAGVEHDHA